MEKFAEAISLAAKIREESYDQKAADQEKERVGIDDFIDYEKFYGKSLYEAADLAAEQLGLDLRGTQPVYLLLKGFWNDSLAWAEQFKKGE